MEDAPLKNRFAAVLASWVLALPAYAAELPARCNDAYLAAMLSGVGQRCPSYHFHLTEAGKRRMYALMRTSGEGECMDLALAKIAVDLSYAEKTAAAANMDAVELWCGSAATFLLPLGDDLVDADK